MISAQHMSAECSVIGSLLRHAGVSWPCLGRHSDETGVNTNAVMIVLYREMVFHAAGLVLSVDRKHGP
jgi:hypothetical protein